MTSGLPDQEGAGGVPLTDRLYTPDDVQHIVAREIAKQQLRQVQDGLIDTNRKMLEMVASFNAELKALRELIQAQPAHVEACKSDLRHEIERDFPSRLEAERMEKRIEDRIDSVDTKVEKQWIRITATIGALSAVITSMGVAMNYWLMVKQMVP